MSECEKLKDIKSCHKCIDRREYHETCVYGYLQVVEVEPYERFMNGYDPLQPDEFRTDEND